MTKYLKTIERDDVIYIILSRPEKGNAYNSEMAEEIKEAFLSASRSENKTVVLTAEGKNFCTGADLDWMESSKNLNEEDNIQDMAVIKKMYLAILSCPHPIIGKVYGKIRGGGLGLTAACDVVIASPETDFALTEVLHGLIPGMITPILSAKIGDFNFDDWSSTGRIINAEVAKDSGLISYLETEKNLNDVLKETHQIHPARRDISKMDAELEKYLILSSEHRKKMIRASEIS